MRTILTVIGTRPEAIKLAPVARALAEHPGRFRSLVCSTGQHRALLDPALRLFEITPDIDLDLMRPGQGLSALTARLIEGLDSVVEAVRPDWVLAQGDTATVLAAALVTYYRKGAFGHVEAGLRTGDKHQPFPEEINRRVADLIADAYFVPTPTARANLLAEGRPDRDIYWTGNTGIDAVRDVAARPYDWDSGPLAPLPRDRRFVLVTAHRRESFGPPLRAICSALRELAARFAADGVHFVYPVHLNPDVQGPVTAALSGLPNLTLLPPLDYLPLVHLLKRSELVLTDSGGIQEEAPALKVPVLVLRATTERPEGVAAGVARLVGTDPDRIVAEAARLLTDPAARAAMTAAPCPYGDGHAARRIVAALLEREKA